MSRHRSSRTVCAGSVQGIAGSGGSRRLIGSRQVQGSRSTRTGHVTQSCLRSKSGKVGMKQSGVPVSFSGANDHVIEEEPEPQGESSMTFWIVVGVVALLLVILCSIIAYGCCQSSDAQTTRGIDVRDAAEHAADEDQRQLDREQAVTVRRAERQVAKRERILKLQQARYDARERKANLARSEAHIRKVKRRQRIEDQKRQRAASLDRAINPTKRERLLLLKQERELDRLMGVIEQARDKQEKKSAMDEYLAYARKANWFGLRDM